MPTFYPGLLSRSLCILLWLILPAQAVAQVTFHDNEADFQAAMLANNRVFKGVENFEESTAAPNALLVLGDPVQSGVPSPFFPQGLEGLDNLTIQSNFLGGNPVTPAPRGAAGLVLITAPLLGFTSDVVKTNAFADSHDMIFSDPSTVGVGFNPQSTFAPGVPIVVRVFDLGNVVQVAMTTTIPDTVGNNFLGIESTVGIGRINLFSTAFADQCADNITCYATGPPPDVHARKGVEGDFIEGGRILYTIVLTNTSTNRQPDNPGDEFFDQFPPEVRVEDAFATSGAVTADRSQGTVAWNGVVPGNGEVTLFVNALVLYRTMGQTICNQGQVFYDASGIGTNDVSRLTDDPALPGDEDPTCFDVPTVVPSAIPTLGEWGLLGLCLLMGMVLVRRGS